MHIGRALAATTIACLATLALAAAPGPKPNFSGSWKVNLDKSDYGPMPKPQKWERTISHNDPVLKYTTVQTGPQGEITTETTYTTDGKECVNRYRGQDVKGSAKWDGDVLTIESKRSIQGTEISQEERWSLSPDGKTLTFENHLTTPQGELNVRVVADKQ